MWTPLNEDVVTRTSLDRWLFQADVAQCAIPRHNQYLQTRNRYWPLFPLHSVNQLAQHCFIHQRQCLAFRRFVAIFCACYILAAVEWQPTT